MKLYLNNALIKTVREPETFRTPKNLILQCLTFSGVFLIMQLIQAVFLTPCYWEYIMTWGSEQLKQNKTISTIDLMREIKSVLLVPEMMNFLLYSTIAGTLVILFFCRFVEERKFQTMGFSKKKAGLQYLAGLGIGFLLFSCVTGLSYLMGGLQFESVEKFTPALFITLLGFGFQGMNEEVAYRGYFMTSILRNHNIWWAVGLNSLFFGLAHALNGGFNLFTLVNLVLYAVAISLYVLRTNSLWGACAIHSIWNFAEGSFYGLPVSGVNVGRYVFRMSLKGSPWVNGGDFGLEASIPATIVLTAFIIILLFCPFRKEEETT